MPKNCSTSASSSTNSSHAVPAPQPEGMETPRNNRRQRKGSGSSAASGDTDSCSFDFSSPDHPFLNAVTKERILAVAHLLKDHNSSLANVARKNKYIFGNSSEEDEEPNAPVFKKIECNLQVMKYDREVEEVNAGRKGAEPGAERRSNRARKRNQRYSSDGDRAGADESVDYKPDTSGEKSTSSNGRKRKATEESKPSAPEESEPPSKASKAKKTSENKNAAIEPSQAGPSKSESDKPTSKRSGRPKKVPTVTVVEEPRKKPAAPAEAPQKQKQQDLNASATSSSGSESSHAHKPRLMFTKMSPEPYERIITSAGGQIVDMPELATILVSDRVYRTYKFLCALAKGIPIVGQPYLDAVAAKRDFVDPWDYILQDHEIERRFKFNLKKSLTLARETKIFQDYSVLVTDSTKPPPEELQLIVASAGGRVIKFPAQQPKHAGKLFAVSDPQDMNLWPKFRERFPDIEIISTEGFMVSIMQHYKNFRSYRLT